MTEQLEIRILQGVAEQNLAREIFDLVWPSDEGTQITSNLMQALSHNGAYVSGGFIEDEVVAAAFAFPGLDQNGHSHLHSHMAAVKPEYRNQNIGSAIKWHQRDWALANGLPRITWTFDPLVRRNAKLNLIKLGARVFQYFPDFYGDLPDVLNAGDPTDRTMAQWELESERVIAAGKNQLNAMDPAGISIALDMAQGLPVEKNVAQDLRTVLCYVPEDIIEIRTQNAALALKWRLALRNQLQLRLESGWRIEGFTTDGAYVVTVAEERQM